MGIAKLRDPPTPPRARGGEAEKEGKKKEENKESDRKVTADKYIFFSG